MKLIESIKKWVGPDHCQNCGKKVIKYQCFDDINGKKVFDKSKWKNLFKIDFQSFLFLIIIVFISLMYMNDTAKCDDAINDPCKFCKDTGCLEHYTDTCNNWDKQEYNFNLFENYNQSNSTNII